MYINNIKELNEQNDVRQIFVHRINPKIYGSDADMFKRVKTGEITKADIDIISFLYETRMATEEQILRRFPALDGTLLEVKVNRFFRLHLMNAFILGDEESNDIDQNALKIYTIDYSAIPLLSRYTDDRDLQNWNARALITNVESIRRILLATDFRVSTETKLAVKPVTYDSYRLFLFGRIKLIPQAQMFFDATKEGDETPMYVPYLVLCFTHDDFDFGDRTRVNEMLGRYEMWYSKKSWKKNFKYAPQIVAVCDTAETMTSVKDLIEEMAPTEIEYLENAPEGATPLFQHFRVTCKQLIDKNMETCMVKYNLDKKKWTRLKSHIFEEKKKN